MEVPMLKKSLIALALATPLVVGLAACGESATEQKAAAPAPAAPAAAPAAPAPAPAAEAPKPAEAATAPAPVEEKKAEEKK
jgi:hypothetical protein